MLFYDCTTAPSPRRARMFIAEKGLDIDTLRISLAENEQLSPAFLKVNPRATVPVLITDEGSTLTENMAIATYLEARYPEPSLLGRDADEKGRVAMWNAIAEFQGGMPVAEVLRNSHPAMKGRALPGPLNLDQIPRTGKARSDAGRGVFRNVGRAGFRRAPGWPGTGFPWPISRPSCLSISPG